MALPPLPDFHSFFNQQVPSALPPSSHDFAGLPSALPSTGVGALPGPAGALPAGSASPLGEPTAGPLAPAERAPGAVPMATPDLPKPRAVVMAGKRRPPVQRAPGAFITPQSLLQFPVASGLVLGLWQVAQLLLPTYGPSLWTGFGISFAIGILIFGISVSDPNLRVTPREKLISLAVAVVNCLYLFMTAVGIKT